MLKRVVLFAMLVPMVLGACSSKAEIRYRISYTVDDNGVSRSASGVWSDTIRPAFIPLVTPYETEFSGEAIPLSLPRRGVLLLTPLGGYRTGGIYAGMAVRQMFAHRTSTRSSDLIGETAQMSKLVGLSKRLRCERYALPQLPPEPEEMVKDQCLDFTFIVDPKRQSTFSRISVVDGHFTGLKGVRLKDVPVTITRAPVTEGRLDQLLPWLPAAQAYWRNRLTSDGDTKFFAQEIIHMKQ
jgi:hypothetical protein